MVYVPSRTEFFLWGEGPIARPLGALAERGVPASAEVKQALVSVDAAYRLTEHLEVLAGLRYNDLQLDVAVVIPAGEQLAGASESWVDPYVGPRFGISLGQRWTFVLRGDVGGFDVGAELAWQLLSRFGWQATERVDAFFGYRVLDVDYEDGNGAGRFSYDVRSSGPLAGVAWRF